jgi:hypothetical protein
MGCSKRWHITDSIIATIGQSDSDHLYSHFQDLQGLLDDCDE